jgi:hypothetical protein
MEIGEFHNKVNDPQIAQLLDNILDAVVALKARLRDSNMDSNSIGGILIPPLSPYNVPMGIRPRTKAPKAEQLKGELKGDLAAYEKFGLYQRSVNQNTVYRYRGVLRNTRAHLAKIHRAWLQPTNTSACYLKMLLPRRTCVFVARLSEVIPVAQRGTVEHLHSVAIIITRHYQL